jgi:cell wall-associated NlpC family hydrolase
MAVDPVDQEPVAWPLSMTLTHWSAKYVGIPFADVGAGTAGCNCWGLVRMVLANECGIALPAYGEISARDITAAARQMNHDSSAAPWSKVGDPQSFDVALMHSTRAKIRAMGHVGVMTSPTELLHIWEATDAVIMPISHPRVRHTLIGFYRHESLREAAHA